MIRVCIVQKKPEHLNLPASMSLLEKLLYEAANEGTNLVVFGETWLTGYPKWLDLAPDFAYWDHAPAKDVYNRLWKNSIVIPGDETKRIGTLARKLNISVGIGVNEKVIHGAGNKTLFNTFLLFDEKGSIRIHHRKLMPTYTEKLLYGTGDGHGLKSAVAGGAQISGLICWEHWMPMARQVLHHEGEEIHLALWPWVHEMHQVASRHYAFEGRCFVLAAGQIMARSDIPAELSPEGNHDGQDLILRGGSCIIGPDGSFITEPLFDRESMIYANLDLQQITREQMTLSTGGHYSRPDIFKLKVNRKRP